MRTNLKLLRWSLKKYDRTLKVLEENIGEPIRKEGKEFYICDYRIPYGVADCPLCAFYNNDETEPEDCCVGCCIAESTGKGYCYGTPYWGYENALYAEEIVNKTLVDATREERDFIKNLYEQLKKK
jgi:hypothetical protein